jgi:hypothetical protein
MVDDLNYQPMRDMHRMTTVKQKDGSTKQEPYYKAGYGYFTSLKGAVRRIAQEEYKKALTGRETALNEAIKLMDETVTRFERILEGIRE